MTIIDSSAKSWCDGLLVSVGRQSGHICRVGYNFNASFTLSHLWRLIGDLKSATENGSGLAIPLGLG